VFNYIPQDAHNVDLNFKDLVTGSADFDFGSSGHVLAQIDVFINASVCAEINVLSYENNQIDAAVSTAVIPEILSVIGQYAQIDAVLNTAISPDLHAVIVNQSCSIDTVLDTEFQFEVKALSDINHVMGVSHGFNVRFQKAIACLSTTEIPWAKPVLRFSNEDFFYDQGLVISNQANIQYEQAGSLTQAIRSIHEQATGLSSGAYVAWEEGDKRFIHQLLPA
jgi:hypothetical protein